MLPIRDTEPTRYGVLPFTTVTLIVVNALVMIWERSLPGKDLWRVIKVYGFTPSLILAREGAGVISTITSMFLHGGILHLVGNMWFLWIFGRRVEDACGPVRFLLYYVVAGTSAALFGLFVEPDSSRPGIGASGAIFGVMGAYLLLFPGGRIGTLVFIPPFLGRPWLFWGRLRAFWVVLFYLVLEVPPSLEHFLYGVQDGVWHFAHLGGFFACISIPLFIRPEAFARYMTDHVSV
jgi:membrane associated rhomboid family serine protease